MKTVNSIILIVALSFTTVAFADYPKDTLRVETIPVIQNGTGSGKNISYGSFTERYWTAEDCSAAAKTYNARTYVVSGGNNVPVITIADCRAINHTIYQ